MESDQSSAVSNDAEPNSARSSRMLEAAGFAEIVAQNEQKIYAFMLARVRNEATAEDLTQDVLKRAWKKRHLFDCRRDPSAWLFRVAYRVLVSDIRSRKAKKRYGRHEDASKLASCAAESEEPWETAAQAESAKIVRAALDALRGRAREIAYMHYYAGLAAKTIAETLGMSEVAVTSSLHRTREKLKMSLMALSRR